MFFRVGDKVVCINDQNRRGIPLHLRPKNFVKINNIYTIRELTYFDQLKNYGVLLKEITNPPVEHLPGVMGEPHFVLSRFAKIDYYSQNINKEEYVWNLK